MIKVGLLNYARVALPFTMEELLVSLQEYSLLLERAWGVASEVAIAEDVPSLASGVWPLFLADRSNEPGAIAYHTLASTGQPWGVAFVQTAWNYHEHASVAVAHELAEMLIDPGCARLLGHYALEICDPVQQGFFASKNGLLLANFVYPAWFGHENPDGSHQLDHMESCTAPHQILQGGYASIWQPGHGWTNQIRELQGAVILARKLGTTGSRLCRRSCKPHPGTYDV